MAKSNDQISTELGDIESKTTEILEILKSNPNPDQRVTNLVNDIKDIIEFIKSFQD